MRRTSSVVVSLLVVFGLGQLAQAGAAKGAYTLKEKSQGSVVETGTWTAKKK